LFATGLQNSLVTRISNVIVRTTRLTCLFTDLGIELSPLFFYKMPQQKEKLWSSIKLRPTIILCFFTGGTGCGVLYSFIELNPLIVATALLIARLI